MYQISEFSKISDTSIQTLRYYDNLELLKPKVIGEYNSYRYYTKDQLLKLKMIKKLKNMGFKLKDILRLLNKYDENFLNSRKKELQDEVNIKLRSIKDIEEIIKKLRNRKQSFEKELINLINKEERKEMNMKEKYNSAKERLLKCYELYQESDFDNCLILLEELKANIFNTKDQMDPFWSNAAGDIFTGISFEIFKNKDIKEVTFLNISQLRINGKEILENLSEYVDSLPKDSYSYISLSGISFAPEQTKASIISVYQQVMKQYAMFDTTK
ncbi:MAG: MerR family transcriptional regulator [Bacilli bacterium]